MESCTSFKDLEKIVVNCRLCPRLVKFRETVPKRAEFKDETYWRRPLPGFGDKKGKLLIFGLAPSAHGGNRTGRIFTGDATSVFLLNALYKTGFANQPYSISKNDQLKLMNCYMTAAVKCAPPDHHPLPQEFRNCSRYFRNELFLLRELKAVLILGKFAFDTYIGFLKDVGFQGPFPKFKHGMVYHFEGWPTLHGSYHPSPQNTYTKKLTERMLIKILLRIKENLA